MTANLSRPPSRMVRELVRMARPHRWWVVAAVAGALGNTAFALLRLHYVRILVDTGSCRRPLLQPAIFAWLGGAIALGIVAGWLGTYAPQRLSTCVGRDLRRSMASAVAHASFSGIRGQRSGDLLSRLNNDVDVVCGFLSGGFSRLLYQPLMAAAAAAYLCVLDWRLLCVFFVVTPISAWLILRQSRREARLFAVLSQARGRMTSRLKDALDNIDSVKAYSLEETVGAGYARDSRRVAETGLRAERIGRRLLFLILSVGDFPDALVVIVGGLFALLGEISLGSLLVFMRLMEHITGPSSHTYTNIRDLRKASEALRRIREILSMEEQTQPSRPEPALPRGVAVRCRQVSFSYVSRRPVLDAVTLTLPCAGYTAVVGATGCGKSTLLALICGLHRPTSGEIQLAGPVAFVDQDAYLFSGSVRENIGYGRPGAGRRHILAAAGQADAHRFTMELPRAYATRVGERGIRLSGGERQRVSLARALLSEAPILCLDEPTASVDPEAEDRIRAALIAGAATACVVVASHRLTMVSAADRIIVPAEGRIAQAGTHRSLVSAEGPYRRLFAAQMQGISDPEARDER